MEQVQAEFEEHRRRVMWKVTTLQFLLEKNAESALAKTLALETQVQNKNEECRRIQNFLQNRKDKSIKLEAQLEDLQCKLDAAPKLNDSDLELTAQVKKLTLRNADLEDQVATLKKNAKESKTRNSITTSDNERLQKLVEELREQLEKKSDQLKQLDAISEVLMKERDDLYREALTRELKFRTILSRKK